MNNKPTLAIALLAVPLATMAAAEIEPTWESIAADYHVPDWFVDGKIGVWFHWGISSATDEDRLATDKRERIILDDVDGSIEG